MESKNIVAILAAGKGTRMYSNKPKVLHEILDKSMIKTIINRVEKTEVEKIYIIGGHEFEQLKTHLGDKYSFTYQKEQKGTGDAIKTLKTHLENEKGSLLILPGDMPLIKTKTLNKMWKSHLEKDNDLTILTTFKEDPFGYGRIHRKNKKIDKIIEEKDATQEEKKIKEVNTSVYIFKISKLLKHIDEIKNQNEQKEYYLTDLISIFNNNNYTIKSITVENDMEVEGVNNIETLVNLTKYYQHEINQHYIKTGISIHNQESVFIGEDVEIEKDVYINGNIKIKGKCKIGSGCKIIGNTIIENSNIGENTIIDSSRIINSEIKNENNIGPFSVIREKSIIGKNNIIGNFVEIKNTKTAKNVKIKHHTYLGDCLVGENTNIGCGTITANYDGTKKHQTIIGANVFVGSNVNLISPVNIADNSKIAAGSTINEDVKEYTLAIARSKQVNKENYLKKGEK